jgi:hypothetical protein
MVNECDNGNEWVVVVVVVVVVMWHVDDEQ